MPVALTDSFLTSASGPGERVWLPRALGVRVTALRGIWSLLPRTASPDAWNFTMSDSRLWEIIALTPVSNNNNNPSWLHTRASLGSHRTAVSRQRPGGERGSGAESGVPNTAQERVVPPGVPGPGFLDRASPSNDFV